MDRRVHCNNAERLTAPVAERAGSRPWDCSVVMHVLISARPLDSAWGHFYQEWGTRGRDGKRAKTYSVLRRYKVVLWSLWCLISRYMKQSIRSSHQPGIQGLARSISSANDRLPIPFGGGSIAVPRANKCSGQLGTISVHSTVPAMCHQ